MESITHTELVRNLVKPGSMIVSTMTPEKAEFWHMATGISGEAGELLDAVKKHVIYTKPLDRENAIEEVGDLLFYIEGMCQLLGITVDEAKEKNIEKLRVRYSGGVYSDAAAQERADKVGEQNGE